MTGPLLLADWGTTNRRAWLLDGNGRKLTSTEDQRGMLAVPRDGWEAAFEELKHSLGSPEPRLSLLTGMVGANRGWRETPYLPCPVDLEDLARELCWVEPGSVAIVPGLAYAEGDAADVMRGEETQVLGAVAAGLAPADCLACLPGTHTKWVVVRDRRVTAFRTVMTGELFALLGTHSILAEQLRDPAKAGPDFYAGVDRGLAGAELTADLFGVRARALLGTSPSANGAAFASGLLIGADLRAGLAISEERNVHVIGRTDLATLYTAAIERSGYTATPVDGGEAVLAGLKRLAELTK
ncbi:MAG TPA: 2-dehydro-3-deoxygalactonokinase [Alteraurantiacibacter sp.]